MSNQRFNERYIEPVRRLTEELGTPNREFFSFIPQSLSRFYFYNTNNTFAVLVSLISWMNGEGRANVVRSALAENSRVNIRTVDSALKELVSKGFIEKKKNVQGNQNEANTYIFKNLTQNPYLLLSEAIHTMKKGIRHKDLRKSLQEFIDQIQKEKASSLLIKRIEKEARENVHAAFKTACEAVAAHLKDDIGVMIDLPLPTKKRENPATKAGKKKKTAPKHNREWVITENNSNGPKVNIRF